GGEPERLGEGTGQDELPVAGRHVEAGVLLRDVTDGGVLDGIGRDMAERPGAREEEADDLSTGRDPRDFPVLKGQLQVSGAKDGGRRGPARGLDGESVPLLDGFSKGAGGGGQGEEGRSGESRK